MSNLLVVYATRYGSTKTIAEWITERFAIAGHIANSSSAEGLDSPEDYDMIVMGSGIYGHGFLSSMSEYIKVYQPILTHKKTALFGVAMRTETFFKNGKAYGGAVMLEKYGSMLGKGCAIGRILGGEMVYDSLSANDKDGLEKFYSFINLTDEAKEARRSPRTLLNKKECWDFAEDILKLL